MRMSTTFATTSVARIAPTATAARSHSGNAMPLLYACGRTPGGLGGTPLVRRGARLLLWVTRLGRREPQYRRCIGATEDDASGRAACRDGHRLRCAKPSYTSSGCRPPNPPATGRHLPAADPAVQRVPPGPFRLADPPAEQDLLAVALRREVEEAAREVFHL